MAKQNQREVVDVRDEGMSQVLDDTNSLSGFEVRSTKITPDFFKRSNDFYRQFQTALSDAKTAAFSFG